MRRRRTVPAVLLTLSVFFSLAALSGAQATGSTAGPVLLGRLAAALFEIDRWTPEHREDLEEAARNRITGTVEVKDLPVTAFIPISTALSGDDRAIADAVAADAGRRLWEDGRTAFVDGEGAAGDFSLTSRVRWTIDLLERDNNAVWTILLGFGLVTTLALLLLNLLVSTRGFANSLRAGLAASLLFAIVSGAMWFLLQLLSRSVSAPVDVELARIGRDCAWIGVRAGLAIGVVNLAGLLLLRATSQRDRRYAEWPGKLDEPAWD